MLSKHLEEDLGGSIQIENDLSASLISNNNVCEATIIFKEDGILCGTSWATEVFNILKNNVDVIMLDNFSIEMIHQATEINKQKVPLEVSGDINLNNLTQYLDTNVDYISIGALTKNIKALDLSLRIK